MRRGTIERLLAIISVSAIAALLVIAFSAPPVRADTGAYAIYPTPQDIEYGEGDQTLRDKAKVVVEDGIDEYTVDRLEEALSLKGIAPDYVDEVPAAGAITSVLVGVKGSGGPVDTYAGRLVESGELSYDEGLFDQTDSYVLASVPAVGGGPDQIVVLGRDTDAAFYGLTTLYQIFQQINGAKLAAFTVSDYADVPTRGFIEGYYGNPWSTQDRINLMSWGGYYKLNAYFYAPKDDPKHNAQWRDLYTDEELETLIEPLAEAGNASKCRFLFALHPFMSNPITSSNYDESVAILKEKFQQVMDHGVRAIAILADDAANQGDDLYIRLLEDMTAWIHDMQAATNDDGSPKYPGLRDTIVFVPVNYYGLGEAWYSQLPENIEVANTGGRIWGKVDSSFLTSFQSTSGGKSAFMWVNWPCSDNDKNALHMGGHNNFLGSDVQPGQVTGVVLNPMQQSEPSKQGIFMNADFSWNLWTSTEHADEVWEDSFSYIDHNSPIGTTGSNALRELSRHMLQMYGGGVTWENGESSAIRGRLEEFRASLGSGTVTEAQCDEMIGILEQIKGYADDYRADAGTPAMLEQIDPWISTFEDLAAAGIAELEAVKADLSGDSSTLLSKYAEGSDLLTSANDHEVWYIDHYEYARVGKAYLTPTITALDEYVAERAKLVSDPDAVVRKFITNREDAPSASTDVLFDGDVTTGLSYKTPASLTEGTYFGYEQSKSFDLTRFTITYSEANPKDTLRTGKLQVLRDVDGEKAWEDVEGAAVTDCRDIVVDFTGLDEKGVYGARLIATADNSGDCWLTINEIEVNKADTGEDGGAGALTGAISLENLRVAPGFGSVENIADGSDTTYGWLEQADGTDTVPEGAAIVLELDREVTAPGFSIGFIQGVDSSDVIGNGVLQYRSSADGAWVDAAAVTGAYEQTLLIEPADGRDEVTVEGIRIVNREATGKWWKVFELSIAEMEAEGPRTYTGTVSFSNMVIANGGGVESNSSDADNRTETWFTYGGDDPDYKDWTVKGAAIEVAFGTDGVPADQINFFQGTSASGDVISDGTVSYREAGSDQWVEAGPVGGDTEQSFDLGGRKQVAAIRVVNNADKKIWWRIADLNVSTKGGAETAPSISTNIPAYQGNVIDNAMDENDSTRFWSSRGTQQGDYVVLALGQSRYIDTVRVLQGASDRLASADIYYTTDAVPAANGSWQLCGSLGTGADQEVAVGRVRATGIKIVCTRASDNWLQLFELQAYEKYSYTRDNLYASFDISKTDLSARVAEGLAVVEGAPVVLPSEGDVVAVDLGAVRRGVSASGLDSSDDVRLVISQNGLEWTGPGDGATVAARFIGLQAIHAGATADLAGAKVAYLHSLDPSLISTTLGGSGSFDAGPVFDGDVSTVSTIDDYPSAGDTIVFDLGQERSITSLEYFVPEGQLNFIRNAVVEAAEAPDAQTWTTVLDINSGSPVENAWNENTAKDAPWMTHSSEFPGNMYVSSGEMASPVAARYLRVRFTADYGYRWVAFGELRINGGEYASPYAGGDFESTVVEQEGMTPDLMLDNDLTTAWAPAAGSAGTLVYHVSAPLTADGTAYEGVRIISRGTPTAATVRASVYTDETFTETREIVLGTLDQVSQEFRFGEPLELDRADARYAAVKDIVIDWTEGTVPQISEIYLLDAVSAADPAELQALIDRAEAADTSGWTKSSATALASALDNARRGVDRAGTLTDAAVSSLAAALQGALDGGVPRYAGDLRSVVDGAITDGSDYTVESWQAYSAVLAKLVSAASDTSDLSQADGESLVKELEAARAALVVDTTASDRGEQAIDDVSRRYPDAVSGDYTHESWGALEDAVAELRALLDGEAAPSDIAEGTRSLGDAIDGLVDVTALVAAREDFEGIADPSIYTPESWSAYKKAYDESAEALEGGSAEDVSAAVVGLQKARGGLELDTSGPVDLDGVIAAAEALDPDDYTASSWAVLASALEAARTQHDSGLDTALAQGIEDARGSLVSIAALRAVVERAEAIDTSSYAEDGVRKLTEAVGAAKALYKDGRAEDIEKARQSVISAIEGLEPASPQSPSGGWTDGEPVQVDAPADKEGSSSEEDGAGGLPRSGDSSIPVIAAAAVGALVALVVGIALRRRR